MGDVLNLRRGLTVLTVKLRPDKSLEALAGDRLTIIHVECHSCGWTAFDKL